MSTLLVVTPCLVVTVEMLEKLRKHAATFTSDESKVLFLELGVSLGVGSSVLLLHFSRSLHSQCSLSDYCRLPYFPQY